MAEKLRGVPHRLLGHFAYLRKYHGLSLLDIQSATGIAAESINSWELGRTATRIRNVDAYAAYWGLTVELAQDGKIIVPKPSPWLPSLPIGS